MIPALIALVLSPTFVRFGGYRWEVRDTKGASKGPGPNVFSADPRNVRIDGRGLHLRIARRDDGWRCAQVVLDRSLGYGTYRFTLDTPVDRLDPRVVLGLFTYDDAEAEAHRELDIEFSRWGDASRADAQFVIQPYERPENIVRFELPRLKRSVHRIDWTPEKIVFSSETPSGEVLSRHAFVRTVPHPGAERANINLWLFGSEPPQNGREVEVVLSDFHFAPFVTPKVAG